MAGDIGGEPIPGATPEEFTKMTGVGPGQPAVGVAVTPEDLAKFRASEIQVDKPPLISSPWRNQTAGLTVTAEETARREAEAQGTESTPAAPEQVVSKPVDINAAPPAAGPTT